MNDTTKNSASLAKLEKLFPGFTLIAGPYATFSTSPEIQQYEKAAAVRALRDHRAAGTEAKLVTVGKFAYVLRTLEGFKIMHGGVKPDAKGDFGIRAGRGGCQG